MKSLLKKITNILPGRKKKSKAIDFIDLIDDDDTPWWGTFKVNAEQSRYSKIGHIVLCIDHYNQEWRIAFHSERDSEKFPSKSLGISMNSTEIRIRPALPDRSIVANFEYPLFIPANQELILYVSSPAMICLELSNPASHIIEIPTEVLPDTWYGNNTLVGELCYAGGEASLRIEDLHRDTTKIVTPVSLVNYGSDTIMVKDLKIPSTQLSIYQENQNHLWTEQLSIEFEDEHSRTSILRNKESKESKMKDLILLSSPRHSVKSRFGGLFRFGNGKNKKTA